MRRQVRGARWLWFKIRQLTDVSHCKLQHHLSCNRHRALQEGARTSQEQSRRVTSALPDQLETGPLRNLMNAMAPTRPTELHGCRVRLTKGPAAPAEARRQVRAAICAWDLPVDPSVA